MAEASSPWEAGKDDLVGTFSGVGWAARCDRAATKGVGFTGVSRLAWALVSMGISRKEGAKRCSGMTSVERRTSTGVPSVHATG